MLHPWLVVPASCIFVGGIIAINALASHARATSIVLMFVAGALLLAIVGELNTGKVLAQPSDSTETTIIAPGVD